MPGPPLHRVRRLSYSALALYERCSYRFYAERVVGLRPVEGRGRIGGQEGLVATEIGDAVHALLEQVDLAAPRAPEGDELAAAVRNLYPAATDDEIERVGRFVASYCESELAARVGSLDGARVEVPFAFEQDGVLLHGRLDVLHRAGGRAFVLDYKTNSLAEGTPEEIVEHDYRLQRLVYALACFRAGADEVEVVYHFLERPRRGRHADVHPRGGPRARGRAVVGDRSDSRGRVPTDPERIRLRRLPGPRRRLRRPAPARSGGGAGVHRRRGRVRSFVAEARRRVGPKRNRIVPIIERLAAEHEDATIALRFRSPLELLVSVMLSAQTTDVSVNRVTEKLFEKYRRPEDYLAVPVEELEQDIHATGFFRQKARALRGTMKMLIEEFDGEVPSRLEELVRLPGVARKTANVVAAELGEPQGVVVDTHVRRLSQRLGLTRQEDPVKIERDLIKLVPRPDWGRFPHLLIWHGRRVCLARAPRCETCVLNDLCPASRLPAYERGVSATSIPPSSS